jgi:hypothetical protein
MFAFFMIKARKFYKNVNMSKFLFTIEFDFIEN